MTPANAHIARVLADTNEVWPMELVFQERGEKTPIVTSSTDPKRLREALDKTFELLVRERGITKELAAVLKDVAWRVDDIRDMLLRRNGRDESIYGCDEWSTPTVNLATAHKVITDALSKVPQ